MAVSYMTELVLSSMTLTSLGKPENNLKCEVGQELSHPGSKCLQQNADPICELESTWKELSLKGRELGDGCQRVL